MTITESEIWDRFNKKSIPDCSEWLQTAYSLKLSQEVRDLIGERLGLLGNKGWTSIKILIKRNGPQPELINAAGLSHHKEARDLLLERLNTQDQLELRTVKALACWGATIPIKQLKKILNHNSKEMRLAGLNLLGYKSHLLNDIQLLELVEDLIIDFRQEVVIETINLLQRRSEDTIINCISKIARNRTDEVVEIAIIALGSIGTKQSSLNLQELTQELEIESHKTMAKKQLSHQYGND
tara:strand:- start:51 stop:767 length:717 start_codon:yes stop_codon:yes gene_type:complete